MSKSERTWSGHGFKDSVQLPGDQAKKGYGRPSNRWDHFICPSCSIEFSSYTTSCPYCGIRTTKI